MYKIIDESGNLYCQYKYEKEAEFERMVVSNAEAIFGASGIYFDMKRLIGTPKKGAAVPDGYYLDPVSYTHLVLPALMDAIS